MLYRGKCSFFSVFKVFYKDNGVVIVIIGDGFVWIVIERFFSFFIFFSGCFLNDCGCIGIDFFVRFGGR